MGENKEPSSYVVQHLKRNDIIHKSVLRHESKVFNNYGIVALSKVEI